MGEPTEGFSFTDGPYLQYFEIGTTDGTTNPQVLGSDFANPMQAVLSGATGPYFVEPSFNSTLGQRPMDNFARVLFWVIRQGSVNTTATLSFKRGTLGEEFTPPELIDIDIPQRGNSVSYTTIISRLPMSFMRDTTGGANSDTLRCSLTVNPSQASAVVIAYNVLCVPIIGQTSQTNPPGGRGQAFGPSIQGRR